MKKLGLLSLLSIVLLLAVTSCKDDKAVKEEARQSLNSPGAIAAQDQTTPEERARMGNLPGDTAEEPVGPTTTIRYEEETFDFGTVMDGEVVYHTYVFTNTGDEPLVIKNAKASCGCTVPSWPKNPIAPGKTGEIQVKFDTKGRGKAGGKPQSKRVTVTANTNPSNSFVTIKGLVDGKEEPAAK